VKDISKQVSVNKVLDNVSFTLPQKKITALLGLGRSGKSVLVKILTGEIEEDTGSVKTFGRISLQKTRKLFLPRIGYCSQRNTLYTVFSARQILEFVGQLRGTGDNITLRFTTKLKGNSGNTILIFLNN